MTQRDDRDPPRVGPDAPLGHERAFHTSIQSARVTGNRPLSYRPRVHRSRSLLPCRLLTRTDHEFGAIHFTPPPHPLALAMVAGLGATSGPLWGGAALSGIGSWRYPILIKTACRASC